MASYVKLMDVKSKKQEGADKGMKRWFRLVKVLRLILNTLTGHEMV